jgi:hypothetical protein
VHLPARDYLLYTGAVEAVTATVPLANVDQTPNLWWPSDRAWCVATEIDLPCTYIGGPSAMIELLLSDERIEALPAAPGDPLNCVDDSVRQMVEGAVEQLWANGAATITTSRGTVTASLTKPRMGRRGVLATARVGDNGVSGSGQHFLGRDPNRAIRDEVELYLTLDVVSLVGG